MNYEWASNQLVAFINMTELQWKSSRKSLAFEVKDIEREIIVVERILDRVSPRWRDLDCGEMDEWDTHEQWVLHRKAAIQAVGLISRLNEIDQNIGEDVPKISADSLHTWVWSGAKSLWQSGHFRSAVEDALKKVNAEVQNKVGRRDLSETKLFQESFSENPPQPGKPRLRRMANDGSDTYKSLQRGAMALAEGIYAGIRNPLNHEAPQDLAEQIALEYLAALSVLARWVDAATVETAI